MHFHYNFAIVTAHERVHRLHTMKTLSLFFPRTECYRRLQAAPPQSRAGQTSELLTITLNNNL